MSTMNKLANCHNQYQGNAKKVLCICSAGLLRSPTIAKVLGQAPYNYNTRAAGITKEYALIDVTDVLIEWADEIVVAEQSVARALLKEFPEVTKYICLDIPDKYGYNDLELVELIKERYNEV